MAPCDINMMASLVLQSIRSSLNALERSDCIRKYKRNRMKFKLKNLEIFVLCARKLGNDAQLRFVDGKVCTLASLFQRIHDALPRDPPPYNKEILRNFRGAIANLKKEIDGWYITLLVSLPLPQPTFDEVTDIIDSVLENLDLILLVTRRNHRRSKQPIEALKQPIEALIETITFLRNFIRFATLWSVDPPQLLDNLLANIHAVAVDAAHTSFMYFFLDDDARPNAPALLQMIKMVDPQVDETYIQALTISKLSTHFLSPRIMKDFIDSLLWNLWERLHLDIPIVISTNSELRLVYEFLRLLSNVLKEQPKKFDKRIGELTRVVICDAGILIFSLNQREMEIDVPDSGLLQRINRITQIVKGKDFSIPDLLKRISRLMQRVKARGFSIQELLQIGQGLSDINMMASLVLYSIRYALNDFERSKHTWKDIIGRSKRTKWKLKNLELFVLCARKLGNDAELRFYDGKVRTLSSLFKRIHDALPRNPPPYNWEVLMKFEGTIANLEEEIGGWYNTLLVSLPLPTFDDAIDFIDSLLEHLNGLIRVRYIGISKQPMIEALIETITFLRNFIRFATLRSVEPPQLLDNLLAHIQAVAVDAAHTSFMYTSQHSIRLQMIKMVNHQVDETYTQALTSAKLSTHLLSPIPDKDHDPSVIMKDFIDSLLWNLWERLHQDTPIVISTNSELRLVYEGLRLLRSMLKAQPNKFDKRIGELTRVVICDAGILIFSLYQRGMEMVVPTSGLLQRISRVRQRVEGKDLSIPDLEPVGGNDLPRTNELGFIDFVLENLLRMTSSKACYGFQSQFRMIHDELSSLRCSLGEIEGRRNEQKELEALWNDGVKVVYRVEFLIDDLVFGDFQGSSSSSFDSTVEGILGEVKSINSKIPPAAGIKVKKVSMPPNPVPFQNRAPVADEIVGFGDDITSITQRLRRGSKQLKVVAIVGMPGMGKTTLATKVFKHPSVTHHFHVLLQCCVSQLFHKKNVLLDLLRLVDPDTNGNIEKSEHELSEKLWRHLRRKRYLIFLDDIWDIEAWDSLKASFPDDRCGSRILLTSRHRNVVPQAMLHEEPLSPRQLTDDQSWELIRKKLPLRNERSLELDEIGKQIAANCKGLPLTVVIVAGLLANTEPQGWKIFLESISSVSGADHCMDTLELSYKHLPGHLKQCFLYFGLFPEDHEVSVKRLIWLWIAEGFVHNNESKSLEEVGRDYMMDLVGRSLVMVSKERSRGGVKACRIHDLLHDFCRTKGKEENFVQVLEGGYDEFISFKEPGYMRRLCVRSDRKHFKNLRVFCPRLYSLLFFAHHNEEEIRPGSHISFIIPRYRRLRVLDIRQYSLSWTLGISSEIGLILQLKYLSVGGYIDNIPSSIGSLANLETFILCSCYDRVSMPDTFWNLQKLRHVDIKGEFHLAFEGLEKFPDLCELQSCSNVVICRGASTERLVRKFPNIRKLRCDFYWEDSNEIEILIPDSLRQLESLVLRSHRTSRLGLLDDLPVNLRKLSLWVFLLQQSDVSKIGKLPNLEVLKFHGVDFHENTWDMAEGQFSTLKFLMLTGSDIVRWTASDDQFPCLEKLVLRYCRHLEEIPYCFEGIDTLEMVELQDCCQTVDSFFKSIQEEQTELGNSLKIQISKRML